MDQLLCAAKLLSGTAQRNHGAVGGWRHTVQTMALRQHVQPVKQLPGPALSHADTVSRLKLFS